MLLATAPPSAHAQDVAREVGNTVEQRPLPDAPEGYANERIGEVRWEYPESARGLIRDLQTAHVASWPRVVDELGQEVAGDMRIRVGRNPAEMRALAPTEAPPPGYASGVAYPHRGLILLTLSAPETWKTPDLESVLVHELSHIAFYRAVGDNPVPRWFSEGIAIYQARERSMERTRILWGGTVGDRLLSLERLNRGFPDGPREVSLAYAQSADFVHWLRERNDGEAKFRQVMSRLAEGQDLETALRRTYSTNLTRLEIDWHADLAERYQALPLLMGSGGLWVFAAFLIIIAYVRRRRRDRLKHQQWEEEDAQALGLAQASSLFSARLAEAPAVRVRGATRLASGPSLASGDEDHEVLYVVPPEPRGHDHGIPTVEHDGRSHTLH